MASVTITPQNASFSSSAGTGTIALTVENANWHTDPDDNDIWMAQRKKTNGTWGEWAVFKIKGEDGNDGSDGKGIASTEIKYHQDTQGITPPAISSTGWQDDPMALNPGEYLWTRIKFNYTTGNPDYAYSVSRYGETGTATGSPTMVYAGYYNINPMTGESEQMVYQGNNKVVSVVYDPSTSRYWYAASNAGGSDGTFTDSSSSPASPKWLQFGASFNSVASGVVFAQKGYLDNAIVRLLETDGSDGNGRISAENNHLEMYNGSDALRLSISGEDLTDTSAPSPTTIPARTNFMSVSKSFSSMTDPYIVESLSTATTISLADAGNSVSLSATTVTFAISGGIIASGSKTIYCSAGYAIDGVCTDRTSAPATTITSSTTSQSVVVPVSALTTTLSTGSHTIQIFARIVVTGTVSSSSNFVCKASSASSTANIAYSTQCFLIRANGIRMVFGTNYMFQAAKTGSADSSIEFLIRAGNYGLKVNNTGIYKLSSGDWQPASL